MNYLTNLLIITAILAILKIKKQLIFTTLSFTT